MKALKCHHWTQEKKKFIGDRENFGTIWGRHYEEDQCSNSVWDGKGKMWIQKQGGQNRHKHVSSKIAMPSVWKMTRDQVIEFNTKLIPPKEASVGRYFTRKEHKIVLFDQG